MTTFILLFILVFVAGIASAVYNLRERNKHTKSIRIKLSDKGYKLNNLAEFQDNILGVDVGINKLCIVNIKSERILEYDVILLRDYEIIRDGVTIFKKSNTVSRAVIGGLLFGGVGAIVGAASSKGQGIDQIKSASLKIYTNNIDNPSMTIKIFDNTIKQDAQKKSYLNAAQNFIDRLAIIVK